MIKIENTETYGWEAAIRDETSKGYRIRKNGRYETGISCLGQSISLGTFETEDEAREAVLTYPRNFFSSQIRARGLHESMGRVFNKKYVAFPNGDIFNVYGHRMVGAVDRHGYEHLCIDRCNINRHRIIAELFVQNPNNYECVNHIDGDKQNCSVENLEWCTRSQNTIHAYRIGLEKPLFGENHPRHKLTQESVRFIRKNYRKSDRQFGSAALGRLFGVDKSTVRDVINNETWVEVAL